MERETLTFSDTAPPLYGAVVYEKEYPSEPNLIPAVVFRLVKFLQDAGFIQEGQKNQLSLCFDEALKNAVLHGNGSIPTRHVTVTVERGASCFWVVISDEGAGFDLAEVPDPLDENGLWREGGRGLHLMQHYAKAVEFWDGGSTVALCFPHMLPQTKGGAEAALEEGE
jgi:serine/threonine-protein kinase RsbW